MISGIFVAGTDTDVGKTVVSAGIVRWLRQKGLDAVPMKPVQTGGRLVKDRLVAPDLEACLRASGLRPDEAEQRLMAPFVYEPACSPHLAGRLAGRYPDLAVIKDCANRLLQAHRTVVAEAAGGLMAPVNENETMLDMARSLGYPVVLVARFGLGTINHTLLSVRALKTARLKLIGVVFNRTEPPNPENGFLEEDNPLTISRLGPARVLGKVRYLGNAGSGIDWQHFDEDMPGLNDILREICE